MSDKLPSIDDLPKSNLPSFDEFIAEEKELPSVQDFVENPDESDEIEAEKEEDEAPGTPCSVEESQDLTEIVRLINDVRKDIPDIPEIKYYDEELERLTEQVELVRDSIPEVPEIKYYDDEIASLREEINQNAADIPEIKYYDEQVNDLEEKIKVIKEAIVSLPEPKYYEADLESLKEDILAVKESIPVFPKWVNEVNEVPDFSWIGKTFGVIDSDFVKVEDKLSSIRGRIDQEVKHIFEEIDVKEFESKNSLDELTTNFNTTRDKIYKELREAAVRIHETKHSFRNDDRLLKKDILSKFNVLKQRVEEEVKEFNRKNVETKDIFDGYFTALTEEIANLPEVKYYDEDVDKLKEDIKSTSSNISELYKIVEELKGKQEVLKEELVNDRPITPDPEEKQGKDPLTPTDQQFATLKDLAANYRLFVNRVEQQLYTIGGGGAGFLKDMSDVNIRTGITTGDLLIYGGGSSGQDWVGIASTALVTGGGTGYFVQNSTGIHTTSNVGIGTTTASDALTILGDVNVNGVVTAVNGYFSGILTAHTFEKHEVTDIYSTGIITATKGIQITTLGLNIASGVATLTDGLRVGSAATIYSNGNLTAGIGTFSAIDLQTGPFNVGTAATISANGNATFSGIVTASSFSGDGTGLTGVASTDNIQTATPARFLSNIYNSGISTFVGLSSFQGGVNVKAGSANTSLTVEGVSRFTGVTTFTGNVNIKEKNLILGDSSGVTNDRIVIGTGSDLHIFHNTLDSHIDNNTGNLILRTNVTSDVGGNILLQPKPSEDGIVITHDGSVALYHDDSKTLETSTSGITVTGQTSSSTGFVVGTAATISANGNATFSGIVTATSFVGDGSGLSGITAITINNNADNRLITGSGTANTLNGESTLTYDGTKLSVSTGATVFTNGNIAAAGIVTANGGFVGSGANITAISGSNISSGTVAAARVATLNQDTTGTAALAEGLTGTPNITVGDVVAASLDISGNADIDGTLEADAYTVNGTALDTHIAGVTVTNATNSSHVLVTDNESTDENNLITFVEDATSSTGNVGLEMDGNLTYNPSSGTLSATVFSGSGASLTNIPGIPSESDTAVSSTSATSVLSFAHASYRSASIIIQITQGSAYQTGRYLVIHDGTTATIVEESAVATGSMLGTFTASIVSSNLVVYVNMGSASSATVTVLATKVTV